MRWGLPVFMTDVGRGGHDLVEFILGDYFDPRKDMEPNP